jgi:hypothetical protein
MEFFMFKFLKYLFYFLLILFWILFYFIFSKAGNTTLYHSISKELSLNTGIKIEVHSINILNYPRVEIVTYLQRKAKLVFEGHLSTKGMDMNYTLNSDCIEIKECIVEDSIDIRGNIKGPFSHLILKGQGFALDGNIRYQAIKYTDKVENIHLEMRDINTSKLFKLLGQTAIIQGKANADVQFEIMSKSHKKGTINYEVKDNDFKGIPLSLRSKVTIQDNNHTFTMDILSPYLTLKLQNGKYNQVKKSAQAHYILDIPNLSKLETLLGYKYKGAFYARGEMSYAKTFKITGLSKSFGGMSDFIFEKDGLTIQVKEVLLENIIQRFPIPSMITANATGTIFYNLKEETLVVNTTLKNAKFLHCKLVEIIYEKSGVNMLHETFDNSTLNLTYHESILLGDLKLANDTSYIYLTSATIQTDKQSIDAYFDFKMQKQEFSGKVYGALENPKVNLDMQKLIRYQMDKQVDKLIGKNNRRIMEKMPMGNVAKDLATDMGTSFIKVFF